MLNKIYVIGFDQYGAFDILPSVISVFDRRQQTKTTLFEDTVHECCPTRRTNADLKNSVLHMICFMMIVFHDIILAFIRLYCTAVVMDLGHMFHANLSPSQTPSKMVGKISNINVNYFFAFPDYINL